MFLMMYKCDCCIHIILHKCKYWQWSLWRRIDVWWGWSQYDISPMHNVSQVLVHRWLTHGWWWAQVSPPLQWSSPTTTGAHLTSSGTHIHNAPIVFTEYSCHQHCWETFRLFSLFSRSVQLHHLSQLCWIFVHQHKSSHLFLQFCNQV